MKKTISVILIFCLFSLSCLGEENKNESISYLIKNTPNPQISTVGGEWLMISLVKSGYPVSTEYLNLYVENASKLITETKCNLTNTKYTEYSRLIIALSVLRKDVTNFCGYNMLSKLSDFDKIKKQGLNGPVYALIALDSKSYEIPNTDALIPTTREGILQYILSRERLGGGFSLTGETPDADTTGMVLQALAPYKEREDISKVIERSLLVLSNLQNTEGGFNTSEEISQVILGLCALNIDLEADERFIKNNQNLLAALKEYKIEGKGYAHQKSENFDQMASEQAFLAQIAYEGFKKGENFIFDLREDLFIDTTSHWANDYITQLYKANVISMPNNHLFYPDSNMTRAEFATMIVKALKLQTTENVSFRDVKQGDWFLEYVATAAEKGFIMGTSQDFFEPNKTITREQADLILKRVYHFLNLDYQNMNQRLQDNITRAEVSVLITRLIVMNTKSLSQI